MPNGHELYLISHGAEAADFQYLLGSWENTDGRLPHGDGEDFNVPIIFLLETPGGERNRVQGEELQFRGARRWVPTGQYYWVPEVPAQCSHWPIDLTQVEQAGRYGPYFAYLLRKFRLKNAYFTNLQKCGLRNLKTRQSAIDKRDGRLQTHCAAKFLAEEIKIIEPRIIFCFGDAAHMALRRSALPAKPKGALIPQALYHPNQRNRWLAKMNCNNEVIGKVLDKLKNDE